MAALAISLVVVLRERKNEQISQPSSNLVATAIEESYWDSLATRRVDPEDASPVRLALFVDVECPFCRDYHHVVDSLRSMQENTAIALVNFPLPQHPNAMSGAIAIECARTYGKAHTLLGMAYSSQDSLARVNWVELARGAGINDTGSYRSCLTAEATKSRVLADRAIGLEIGARGTPTVVVDGKILNRSPNLREIQELLR
jgi:protein-disulfide isomerase